MNCVFKYTTLDVVIGLVFVYLLLAIMCTAINEWIAGVFKVRSNNLASAIKQLLDSQPDATGNANGFLNMFYAHPLIAGMRTAGATTGGSHPSYLPARTFASVVMDLVTSHKPGTITFADLEAGIEALPDGDVKKALLALIQNTGNDLKLAQKNIEEWFDDTMDRVSGWYKRTTQIWTVIIALFLTVASNADSVRIARTLWQNPTLRAQIIEKAKTRAPAEEEKPTVDVKYQNPNEPMKPTRIGPVTKDELATLESLLGWSSEEKREKRECWKFWLQRLLGWFLTIVAVSLGAPFWFDVLSKLINIRNSGRKPEKADKQSQNPQEKTA